MLPMMGFPGIVEEFAGFFRRMFSWHQFRRFKQYLGGLITGRRATVRSIASRPVEAVDQSSLNRFLTLYRWDRERVNRRRLELLQSKRETRWRWDGVDIPDLGKMELDGELIFFPLGGSNLARWSSRLANLNRPEFHLCDRSCAPPDPPAYQDHVNQVNNREKCRARSTEKLEIENYLHYEAIVAAYADLGIDLPITTNYGPYDDVPMEVARLVHEASSSEKVWDALSDENKDKKESRVKSVLCKFAPTYMNRTLLGEIDPNNDLLEWFQDVIELCEPD